MEDAILGHLKNEKHRKLASSVLKKEFRDPLVYFELLNELLEEHDKWLYLVIDEFQNLPSRVRQEGFLQKLGDEEIFSFFRGLSENFRISLIVSGSIIDKLLQAIDLWYGRFEVVKLRNFRRKDSIAMLEKLFELSELRASYDVLEYIATVTYDHPFYMQLFGHFIALEGEVSERSIEKARKLVIRRATEYYSAKLLEMELKDPGLVEILRRIAEGETDIRAFAGDDLRRVTALILSGFVYKDNSKISVPDGLFKKYVLDYVSDRPEDKFLPTFTSEYIVLKDVAYREGLREILVLWRSWGPFDIVVYCGNIGVGIQVKESVSGKVALKEAELKKIIAAARSRNLVPVLAIVRMGDVRYFKIQEGVCEYEFDKSKRLSEILGIKVQ